LRQQTSDDRKRAMQELIDDLRIVAGILNDSAQ
jgi:hypothetical protein